jgi:hypothetical protein
VSKNDPFDGLALTDEQVKARLAVVPRKIQMRRKHFIIVPMVWRERLGGAPGHTILVALDLLYLGWKGKGAPVKLANGMLRLDGISRQSKWRALNDLERRGLVSVQRRANRSPLVHLSHR